MPVGNTGCLGRFREKSGPYEGSLEVAKISHMGSGLEIRPFASVRGPFKQVFGKVSGKRASVRTNICSGQKTLKLYNNRNTDPSGCEGEAE